MPGDPTASREAIRGQLTALHAAAATCMARSVATHMSEFGEIHQLDLDIGGWASHIDGPERSQLEDARRELAFAEYAAASGLYRQAFSSVRLFLELGFAAVYFSVHELERRRWLSDRADFSWSAALDSDTGMLSKMFVREFAPTLVDAAGEYADISAGSYRFCSQFVHGKAATSATVPSGLIYDSGTLDTWCTRARQAAEAVLFLVLVRYGTDLDVANTEVLQEIIAVRFGHLQAVRQLIGLAAD